MSRHRRLNRVFENRGDTPLLFEMDKHQKCLYVYWPHVIRSANKWENNAFRNRRELLIISSLSTAASKAQEYLYYAFSVNSPWSSHLSRNTLAVICDIMIRAHDSSASLLNCRHRLTLSVGNSWRSNMASMVCQEYLQLRGLWILRVS